MIKRAHSLSLPILLLEGTFVSFNRNLMPEGRFSCYCTHLDHIQYSMFQNYWQYAQQTQVLVTAVCRQITVQRSKAKLMFFAAQ